MKIGAIQFTYNHHVKGFPAGLSIPKNSWLTRKRKTRHPAGGLHTGSNAGPNHSCRGFTALSLALVLIWLVAPSTAYGVPGEGPSSYQGPEDRLAEEFAAVLSLREAPDSMCLSATLDDVSIIESRSEAPLIPASLMKVATAAAALEVMRPDETYSTEVFALTEAMESIIGGVLEGDVYLIGQGDPVLSTPRYVGLYRDPVAYTDITKLADRVFASLSARGITRIEGGLVGDESWFPDQERNYTREFLPGNPAPVWKGSYVTENLAGPLSALLLNAGYSSYFGVAGAGRRLNVRATNPAQHAASVFDDLLEARGMVITERPRSGVSPDPGERTLLGSVESPLLSEILARMLSRSDNTIAEMLLKEIGRRTGGSDRASATDVVQTILERKIGPSAAGSVIADGSGLSYSNRLTCKAVAELLRMAGPGSALVKGLAVAGRTGTLQFCAPVRSRENDQLNEVWGKTGTLNDSTALAGMTVAAGGETITFAMIANRTGIISLGSCNRLRGTLLNAAANYSYGATSSATPIHAGDRDALVALFDATGGSDWFNKWRWKSGAPLGRWHGVTTNSAGRVTGIDLSGPFGNGMTGSMPVEIGELTDLIRLDLSGNDLSGPLPEQLADLPKLAELNLSGTRLCVSEALRAGGSPFRQVTSGEPRRCPSFVDIGGNSHAPALQVLAERGILDGTGCAGDRICPDKAIERWTMAVWLVRAIDRHSPSSMNTTRFEDVDAGAWWGPYVDRLAGLRITTGCSHQPKRFCPDDPVTRAQMATFLVRSFRLEPAPAAGYGDTAGNHHRDAIDSLTAAGITLGCRADPYSYCPDTPVSRGQMATFIARALGLV